MTWLAAFGTLAIVWWIAQDVGYDRGWDAAQQHYFDGSGMSE